MVRIHISLVFPIETRAVDVSLLPLHTSPFRFFCIFVFLHSVSVTAIFLVHQVFFLTTQIKTIYIYLYNYSGITFINILFINM